MSGYNDFAPYLKKNGCFIVLNISHLNQDYGPSRKKVIKIFHYPINPNESRDLLAIPGVSESDIRASLLKGELRHKLLAKDITVICSDIDLLQFNEDQKQFLKESGIINGLEIEVPDLPPGTLSYLFKDQIALIGAKNGVNRTFYTPDKFINGAYAGNNFHIQVKHNGKDEYEGIDYRIDESGGPGTGYDMITFISKTPNAHSIIYASYVIKI